MISGRSGLTSFDAALAEAGRATTALTHELQALNERVSQLRTEAADCYKQLALMRLKEAGGGAAAAQLDAAAGTVGRLVAARANAVRQAEQALAKAEAEARAAVARRTQARAELERLEDAAEAALEQARAGLASSPAWREAADAQEAADRVAMHTAQKASQANQDRVEKGKPFEADPLFLYLWQRGYGTKAYSAGPISRLMDGFVARVARYEPARRTYAALTDLPEKLAQHAAQTQQAADAARARLAEVEQRAAEAAGGPAAREVATARSNFETAEDAAEAAETALQAAQARMASIAACDDEAARSAATEIEAALMREDLVNLRAAAGRTPSPDDDALVMRIERAEVERWRLAQEIETRREALAIAQRRAGEAEAMRREYRSRGYGGAKMDMGNGAMIGVLLGQVLSGGMGRDKFFDRMESSRRADPWARGGGSGGAAGGFRTGGSIGGGGSGGGGFKTGGGF
jgi:chromosome segregation ATPase